MISQDPSEMLEGVLSCRRSPKPDPLVHHPRQGWGFGMGFNSFFLNMITTTNLCYADNDTDTDTTLVIINY